MLDRDYFERVLPDQVRMLGGRVRVAVVLRDGGVLEVRSIVATYETYVILETCGEPRGVARGLEGGQEETPGSPGGLVEQVAVPYDGLARTEVATAPEGEDTGSSLVFRGASEPG